MGTDLQGDAMTGYFMEDVKPAPLHSLVDIFRQVDIARNVAIQRRKRLMRKRFWKYCFLVN